MAQSKAERASRRAVYGSGSCPEELEEWERGEGIFAYAAQNADPLMLEWSLGSTSSPTTETRPLIAISKTHSVSDGSWSGDGEGQLAALRIAARAVESSQGPAIALALSADTYSSYESGVNALADALPFTSVGISRAGSTRTGQGGFLCGRTESNTGRLTGAEIVADNESETEEEWTGGFPRLKGIHLHAVGTKRSAVGMFISNVGVGFHTGIAAQKEAAISSAFIRDDSSVPISFDIRGSHTDAIKIGSSAGPVRLAKQAEPSAPSAGEARLYLDESGGKVRLMARFPTGSPLVVKEQA